MGVACADEREREKESDVYLFSYVYRLRRFNV